MGDRGASDDRRVQPPGRDPESGAAADCSGDLDGCRVQLHAGAAGIRVRPDVHQLGEQDDRESGSPDRTGAGGRVPLGGAHGSRAVHEHPAGDCLQRVYRPLHPRLHHGSGEGIVDAVRTFYGGGVMRTRTPSFCTLAVLAVLMLGGARTTSAQQVVKFGEGQTLTISGFVSATMFNDRGLFSSFGQGQNAEIAACRVLPTPGCTSAQPGVNQGFTDGDVRNTRINFTFNAGPVLGKWAPKGVIEADFFGAFNGAPPFGDEQPQLRGRLLYADLTNGRTTLRIGQNWAPLFAEVPVSLTHIAFPLGLGAAGMIGWRFPGIFWYQDLSAAGKPMTAQLQLAVMKGSGPATGAVD